MFFLLFPEKLYIAQLDRYQVLHGWTVYFFYKILIKNSWSLILERAPRHVHMLFMEYTVSDSLQILASKILYQAEYEWKIV